MLCLFIAVTTISITSSSIIIIIIIIIIIVISPQNRQRRPDFAPQTYETWALKRSPKNGKPLEIVIFSKPETDACMGLENPCIVRYQMKAASLQSYYGCCSQ